MICNSSLTVYKHGFDKDKLDTWTRFNYKNVWFDNNQNSNTNKGYQNSNQVTIRIPYGQNDNLNFENFSIGDIVVQGTLFKDITTQAELKDYQIYNITFKKNNTYGMNPHIHIGGS